MPSVLDASFALALVLPDEATPSDEIIASVLSDIILVPAHWPTEILNGCLMALRRGRLSAADIKRALSDIVVLGVEVAPADALDRSEHLIAEASKHGLSIYDMAYLELAERRNLSLATRDRKLSEAARSVGVKLL